ncbi:beta-galactosidase [Polaribacter aestuariivivens]|uniref:Beta-galactosidase n=1 Tax=Polaribacter aestuariivivens TaxID=2304626 RepID=A0A5S3N5X9_9FLAO|nr:sugar-binding domain-containing protein [Polaribacter aestuariivivens]TMM30597.1 beta-galactosidase [Polaribacter aestuariivivens]
MPFYKNIKNYILFLSIIALISCGNNKNNKIDLSGEWSFKIDSLDRGVAEKWFSNDFSETVKLPGSMTENDKGKEVTAETVWTGSMWNDSLWYKDPKMEKYRQKGNTKVSFWLTPKKHYVGAAWYKKEVEIPEDWKNQEIHLFLERVHWESTLWVDDIEVSTQNSLGTAHNYNLTRFLTPGKHMLSIRIDNRVKDIDVGIDAHSVSDNTQSNWNGIIGDMNLIAIPKISVGNVKMYPNVADKNVKAEIQLENSFKDEQKVQLILQAKEKSAIGNSIEVFEKEITINGDDNITVNYNMGDNPKLWDEFNPNVYEMEITVKSKNIEHSKTIDFGMRDFKVNGKQFSINDRPVFLRGTLECAIFPLTGYPPTNVDEWKRIYKTIKKHGLNHMRFHSWCPPEAAFIAADEEGVYLQVEASAWTKIGDGDQIDKWLYKEGEDIINAYGNHPSFVMMAYGNEPSGKNHVSYLKDYVEHFKNLDNRRMYTSAAGWAYLDNMDYYNHFQARIQKWNQNLNSIINAKAPQTEFDYSNIINRTPMPYVSHEIGQWCVYPNFEEMSKYTGVLQPKNFEIFKETLEENGMGDLSKQFLMASGKLQALCYKADIEASLRTKNMAGFQLLDLHDFPGQGTALVGVLDPFWDEKGYISPEEFRAFSGQTVPLARFAKRTFQNTDTLNVKVELAHFGENMLKDVTPTWKITDVKNEVFAEGNLDKKDIEIGNGIQLGEINLPLSKVDKAKKLILSVGVNEFQNTWDFWVYPNETPTISNENTVKVVDKLDVNTINYLQNGGNVLFNITKGDIASGKGGDIGIGFSSIFWNTSWTNGQKPHTLGILCDPENPALTDFPTEYHSNWQWWDAMTNSNAIILDDLPQLTPIVRVVDDWFKNRRLGLVFEAKIGKGKLIMSGIDLHTNIDERLEAKQLLYSLKKYMTSEDFNPETVVEINQINSLLK